MKKIGMIIILAVLSALFFVSANAKDPSVEKFDDIDSESWYYDSVVWTYENELLAGTSETSFSPSLSLTRGMFVTSLAKADGVDKNDYPECHFSDCSPEMYYTSYVEWAYRNSITAGTSKTTFSPNDLLTREQCAVMLYSFASHVGFDTSYNGDKLAEYSDYNEISEWARAGLAWCTENGIIHGTANSVISPKGVCTRAQLAVMLRGFLDTQADEESLWYLVDSGYTVQKNPLPESFVSRLDFAYDIVYYTGFDTGLDYYLLQNKFSDMKEDNYDTAVSEIAVSQGYMTAAEGSFLPGNNISYSDAVRGFLYALGYREYAETVDYFELADEIGILNGIDDNKLPNLKLTYAEFGVLAANTLHSELVQCIEKDGQYSVVTREYNNIINNYLECNGKYKNNTLFRLANDGWDIFDGAGYRYGPSMILNDDSTIDMWIAGTSLSGGETDWGFYRKSYDNGLSWTADIAALRPTFGTNDWKWTCDPGVIKIGDYYYCGYTSTSWFNGTDNNLFFARSKDKTDFFDEKWDGSGWSDSPVPVVIYDGQVLSWGTGEPGLTVVDDTIYCYIPWKSDYDAVRVYTAPASDPNWPAKLKFAGTSYINDYEEDSCDVKYIDAYNCYMAVATADRLTPRSYIRVHTSFDGITFREEYVIKSGEYDLLPYIHNMGMTGTADGHLDIFDRSFISYAYALEGSGWGDWNTRFVPVTWLGSESYGNEDEVIYSDIPSDTDFEHSPEIVGMDFPEKYMPVFEQLYTFDFTVNLTYADGTKKTASSEQLKDMEYIYDSSKVNVDAENQVVTVLDKKSVTVIKVKYKDIFSFIIAVPQEYYGRSLPTSLRAESDVIVFDKLNEIKQPSFIASDGIGNFLHLWGEQSSYKLCTDAISNNYNVAHWQQSITYSGYDDNIISIDPQTGIITPKAVGETTVYGNYCGMQAAFKVIVSYVK